MLKKKMTEIAYAISSAFARITGASAAIADAPQMVVPIPIRHRIRQSTPHGAPDEQRTTEASRYRHRKHRERACSCPHDDPQIETGAQQDDATPQTHLADIADPQRADLERSAGASW